MEPQFEIYIFLFVFQLHQKKISKMIRNFTGYACFWKLWNLDTV